MQLANNLDRRRFGRLMFLLTRQQTSSVPRVTTTVSGFMASLSFAVISQHQRSFCGAAVSQAGFILGAMGYVALLH